MGKAPCCDKWNVKRGLWTAAEDAKILAYVSKYGVGNWSVVPKKAGLNRCGKSCRLRWTNYLRPDLRHDSFTPQEEQLIIKLHQAIGSRWSLIAKRLPGRTDNDVKNYWNTKLRKKLSKMGIDPITHKPFSQILFDYGSISSNSSSSLSKQEQLPAATTIIGPFNVTTTTSSSSSLNQTIIAAKLPQQEFHTTPIGTTITTPQPTSASTCSSSSQQTNGCTHQASSSSTSSDDDSSFDSFVGAMFEQDSLIKGSFPHILDASFDY